MSEQGPNQLPDDRPQPQYGAYRPAGQQPLPGQQGEPGYQAGAGQPYQPQGQAGMPDNDAASPAPGGGAPYYPYGKAAPGPAAPVYGQVQQPGYANPYGMGQQPPQGGTGQGAPPDLPARAWPITLTIVGALMAFAIAPMMFFILVFSGTVSNVGSSGLGSFSKLSEVAMRNGQTHELAAHESVLIVAKPDNVKWTCTLTHADGTKIVAQDMPGVDSKQTDGAFVAQAEVDKSGSYTAACVGPANEQPSELAIVPGSLVEGVVDAVVPALGWSTLVGLLGLLAMIVGIVWLVKVNRQRQRILRTYQLY